MPVVHLVPVTHGMSKDEVVGRIQAGWVLAGRQAVQSTELIVDPSKPIPPSGVVDVDVWVLNEPMVPVGLVATRLIEEFEAGGEGMTLDNLARVLTGQGIIPLKQEMDDARAAMQAQEASAEEKPGA